MLKREKIVTAKRTPLERNLPMHPSLIAALATTHVCKQAQAKHLDESENL
jgi:hypothetical protein